jgi:hypothetical protein
MVHEYYSRNRRSGKVCFQRGVSDVPWKFLYDLSIAENSTCVRSQAYDPRHFRVLKTTTPREKI